MGLLTRWLLTFSMLLFPFFSNRIAVAETPWQWPLDPRPDVLRGFDPPEERWLAGHLGADLAADVGQPVLASADGVVHFVGTVAGVPLVSVTHGELRTTYLPVRASTARGDPVRAGDEVGTLAAEPAHCASRPCLHFGLLRASTYLDPLGPLGHGPVRLLPLPGPWRGDPMDDEAEVEPTDGGQGAHIRVSGAGRVREHGCHTPRAEPADRRAQSGREAKRPVPPKQRVR